MLIFDMLQWWYSAGWKAFLPELFLKLRSITDFFSIGQLLSTLFSPYRLIDSPTSDEKSLEDRIQAFLASLVSRFVGTVTRLCIIIPGIFITVAFLASGIVLAIIWPLVPLAPLIGLMLTISGVVL